MPSPLAPARQPAWSASRPHGSNTPASAPSFSAAPSNTTDSRPPGFSERGVRTEAILSGRGSGDRGRLQRRCRHPRHRPRRHAAPTESPVVFPQPLGLGLRPCEGKQRLTIIDFVGNHRTSVSVPMRRTVSSDAPLRRSGDEGTGRHRPSASSRPNAAWRRPGREPSLRRRVALFDSWGLVGMRSTRLGSVPIGMLPLHRQLASIQLAGAVRST